MLPAGMQSPKPAAARPPDARTPEEDHEAGKESRRRGGRTTLPLSRDARFLHHRRTPRRPQGEDAIGGSAFRYPEARRDALALRLPPGLEWRAQELGCCQGAKL